MAKTRTHRGVVAVSAAAIAVVYAAGYIHTQAADAELGTAETASTTPVMVAVSNTSLPSATVMAGGANANRGQPSATGPASTAVQPTPAAARAAVATARVAPPQTTRQTPPVAAAAPSSAQPTPNAAAQSTGRTTPASGSPAGQTPPPPAKPAFKDGTFTGVGNSRRGGVQVAVAVHSGRIASVTITRVSTEYPPSDIAALPREVVSRQSAQVDFVSGATYSSLAFRAAVQQALSKAQG